MIDIQPFTSENAQNIANDPRGIGCAVWFLAVLAAVWALDARATGGSFESAQPAPNVGGTFVLPGPPSEIP